MTGAPGDNIHELSALELTTAIRQQRIGSEAATRHSIQRIKSGREQLNAVVVEDLDRDCVDVAAAIAGPLRASAADLQAQLIQNTRRWTGAGEIGKTIERT